MLHGKAPSAEAARIMEVDLVLHAEHGANASSFAVRGAAEDVMKMVREIGDPANAAAWVKAKRAERLSREMGQPQWYAVLQAVVEAMKPYARLGVNVNVDFYAGVIYHLLGIPQDCFVPIFAMGRVPGWVTQVREQVENNILIRPLTVYDGPPPREWLPVESRLAGASARG